MNPLLYMASVKQIQSATKVSELEALVRKYDNLVNKWKYNFEQNDICYYKLSTLALNRHAEKSKAILPEFLYEYKRNLHNSIINSLLSNPGNLPTYEFLIDLLEFDSVLTIPRNNDFMPVLNSIIGDKPIHFTIDWTETRLTDFDRCSTALDKQLQLYLAGVRYKQVNFPTEYQTVIESYLNYYRPTPESLDKQALADSITKLQQHISAIEELTNDSI